MKLLVCIILLSPLLTFGQSFYITSYTKGYIVLGSGEKVVGEVSFKIINDSDTSSIRFKGDKQYKGKYAVDDLNGFGTMPYLISEVRNDHKDPSQNFHPGYIITAVGDKISGRVAGKKKEPHQSQYKNYGPVLLKYANENDEITFYEAAKGAVSYYVQNINGEETHYVNIDEYFLRVGNPKGRFSYFRNPSPTHVREGLTNLTSSASVMAAQDLTTLEKRSEFLKAYEQTGNFAVAVAKGEEVQKEHDERVSEYEESGEGNIYFKEYFLVDNEKQTRKVVYKKNIEEVLNEVLADCNVSEKDIKKAAKVKDLEDAMKFLENHICN